MTQPPAGGDPPEVPPPYRGTYGQGPEFVSGPGPTPSAGDYPRQDLLPQQVRRGTRRTPVYVGVAAVLALILVAGAAYLLLRDKGEDNRAAYCAELRDLTDNGDLTSAVSGADAQTLDLLLNIKNIAPPSVADDWASVTETLQSAMENQTPDIGKAVQAFNALKVIAVDAKSNCDLVLDIPGT